MGENKYLSPEEISEMVRKRLAECGVNSDKDCSEAFIDSLRKFFQGHRDKLEKKMKFIEDLSGDTNSEVLEKVVHKTSGITARQLEVVFYLFFGLFIIFICVLFEG